MAIVSGHNAALYRKDIQARTTPHFNRAYKTLEARRLQSSDVCYMLSALNSVTRTRLPD
uniref:Uncharacterized protein n=1 Tax=Anguilla anguilla TaxID=7936 RepID=A0A0E9XK91_ANGAN